MKLINNIGIIVGYIGMILMYVVITVGLLSWVIMLLGGAIGTAWGVEVLATAAFWDYWLIAAVITTISIIKLGGKSE